jgi:hypothetical protein
MCRAKARRYVLGDTAPEGGITRWTFSSSYGPGTVMMVFTMVTEAFKPNALPFSTV